MSKSSSYPTLDATIPAFIEFPTYLAAHSFAQTLSHPSYTISRAVIPEIQTWIWLLEILPHDPPD